jgi:pimeloyl-ACP methyl ester carboxylesterase
VIWGADDQVVPLRPNEKALRRAIPHLEFWEVRGVAHLPQLEAPRAFNRLVTRFLAP